MSSSPRLSLPRVAASVLHPRYTQSPLKLDCWRLDAWGPKRPPELRLSGVHPEEGEVGRREKSEKQYLKFCYLFVYELDKVRYAVNVVCHLSSMMELY